MRGAPLRRFLRGALLWAAAVGGTTATISSLGRLLCLPPYWPSGFVGKCRPNGQLAAWLHLPWDVLLTTALLATPLLPLGAAVQLARTRGRATAVAAGLAGAMGWVWLARRLEVSYLDFILGGYAIGAGALVALAVTLRQSRHARRDRRQHS